MLAGWEKVCNFASESPSDEILPRPSQPQKLAIFLKDMSKQKVIVYVDGFNFYYGLKPQRLQTILFLRYFPSIR